MHCLLITVDYAPARLRLTPPPQQKPTTPNCVAPCSFCMCSLTIFIFRDTAFTSPADWIHAMNAPWSGGGNLLSGHALSWNRSGTATEKPCSESRSATWNTCMYRPEARGGLCVSAGSEKAPHVHDVDACSRQPAHLVAVEAEDVVHQQKGAGPVALQVERGAICQICGGALTRVVVLQGRPCRAARLRRHGNLCTTWSAVARFARRNARTRCTVGSALTVQGAPAGAPETLAHSSRTQNVAG